VNSRFEIPNEADLTDFFGAEPMDRSVDDGYWCYEITDDSGVLLRFSFNLYERSVQTVLHVAGMAIATVGHESAERLVISQSVLRCEFSGSALRTTLIVKLGDRISVAWTTLRMQ
jgi:hypothetical protein